jgi:hypothetical protein
MLSNVSAAVAMPVIPKINITANNNPNSFFISTPPFY